MNTEDANEDAPLQLFEICLHREEFFPGEVITGKLLLVTSRPFRTEGVLIKFEGKGAVRWKNQSAHLCGLKEAEFVHENRKYFSNVFRYDLESIPEGCSVLTFEFELPTGIPQSIAAGTIMKQLRILYSLEALIRTSTENYRQQKCIIVKSILNLNSCPELSLPLCKTIREAIFESCWSSSGRVVVINFSINKQGFVPGEQLKAELTVRDAYLGKTPDLGWVEVTLVQEIELQIRTASRIRRRIVGKSDMVHMKTCNTSSDKNTKCANITSKDIQIRSNFSLNVPENILISYGNTDKQVHDFISIRYFLRMSMENSSFPYKPLQIHLPIKIGTVFIKEQKSVAPILILAPVPLVLPRPRVPLENSSKCINVELQQEKQRHTEVASDSSLLPSINMNSMPQIYINSKNSLVIPEQHPNNASQQTPKNKSCNTSPVGDSSGSLCKPKDAFGRADTYSV